MAFKLSNIFAKKADRNESSIIDADELSLGEYYLLERPNDVISGEHQMAYAFGIVENAELNHALLKSWDGLSDFALKWLQDQENTYRTALKRSIVNILTVFNYKFKMEYLNQELNRFSPLTTRHLYNMFYNVVLKRMVSDYTAVIEGLAGYDLVDQIKLNSLSTLDKLEKYDALYDFLSYIKTKIDNLNEHIDNYQRFSLYEFKCFLVEYVEFFSCATEKGLLRLNKANCKIIPVIREYSKSAYDYDEQFGRACKYFTELMKEEHRLKEVMDALYDSRQDTDCIPED